MAITTVYRPCHFTIDLVLCLELKELPDLVVSQNFRYFQLLFFELTADSCFLFISPGCGLHKYHIVKT